ncbi:LysR family transcriptional regulator [Paenibacillus filicis]|uniref:LysR family transcriptional regulator n=1 Tax=Paenibacillus gyeongsangnamensis TaxID=3388067 RepID=A0ABT4Q8F4_9BACL|nr:LysR family transcriptional regulator [Paenibacillus filicis]MCZ8513104.1 LysR family transcriptional regulator [Paenibacillus filicis]
MFNQYDIEVINIINHMDRYVVFYQTAVTGSFTRAAERLFMTQPSVTYAIKQLEEELQASLFVRKSKGVELTEEGSALLQCVAPAIRLLEEGRRAVAQYGDLERGEIRIGASEAVIKHYLLDAIESFHSAHPNIRFGFRHGRTRDIRQMLLEGGADIGLIHLRQDEDAAQLQIHAEWPVELIFISAPSFLPLSEEPRHPKELLKLPMITLSARSSSRAYAEDLASAYGVKLQSEMEVGSVDLLLELTRMGFGCAIVNRKYAEGGLRTGSLIEIPVGTELPAWRITLVSSSSRALPAAARAFLQLMSA